MTTCSEARSLKAMFVMDFSWHNSATQPTV
jgi:hypothetical protein